MTCPRRYSCKGVLGICRVYIPVRTPGYFWWAYRSYKKCRDAGIYRVRTEPYPTVRQGTEAVPNHTEYFGRVFTEHGRVFTEHGRVFTEHGRVFSEHVRVFTEKIPPIYFGTYPIPDTPLLYLLHRGAGGYGGCLRRHYKATSTRKKRGIELSALSANSGGVL